MKENKTSLSELVDEFETSVNKCDEKTSIWDNEFPSINLWCVYETFRNSIFSLLLADSSDCGKRNLIRVYEKLELDSFNVNARESFSLSKSEMISYISRIKNSRKMSSLQH